MAEQPPLILAVEVEYPLQAVIEEALIEAGFATDILSSAEEALTLFTSGLESYRALVADVNLMGSLSGWDLARRIREREPTFPVIYMTGAASDERACRASQTAFCCRSHLHRPSSSPLCRNSSTRTVPPHDETRSLVCQESRGSTAETLYRRAPEE
jgi:CheY-like chemotaxis protein